MTSCADVRNNISAYADNELDINERMSFEEHVKNCPECKRELDEMLQIIRLCSSMPLEPLPEGFRVELHEKLTAVAARNNNVRSIDRPKKTLHAKTFASIAAGILLIFLGGSIVRFGLLSENMKTKNDSDSYNMSAAAPAETPAEDTSSKVTADIMDGEAGIQSATGADMADGSAGIMDYGIMESNQALTAPRSYDINRSASEKGRDDSINIALTEAEMATSKSSEVIITVEDTAAAVETVTTLASLNNGTVPGTDEMTVGSGFARSPVQGLDSFSRADMSIQLQLVFAEDDYNMFSAALNDCFGAANVQIGAFVTEDRTDLLNILIEQTSIYDQNIKELQSKNTDQNSEEINKLKSEKEQIGEQIEMIRLSSDFVTVTVNINEK